MNTVIASTAGQGKTLHLAGAPPSGWQNLGYDDSAWASTVAEAGAVYRPPLSGSTWVTYASGNLAAADEWLLRDTFTLPAHTIITASLRIAADDYTEAVYVNGHAVSSSEVGGGADWATYDVAALLVGGANVLAVHIKNGPPAAINPSSLDYVLTVQDNSGQKIRLVHGAGPVCWEHDAVTFRLRSADQDQLVTPIPTMALQPSQILGKDAATGVPMWSPIAPPPPPPPPVHTTFDTPDETITGTTDYPSPPPAPPPDAQRVCGAAEEMANTLVRIYDAMVWLINKEKGNILAAFTGSLKRELSAQLVSLLTEAELAQFEIDAAQLVGDILLAAADALLGLATKLPQIQNSEMLAPTGDGIYQVIRNCAWQALWLRGGDYLLESASSDSLGTRDHWQTYLNGDWSFFAGSTLPGIDADHLPWQLVMLDAIIKNTPDATWQNAAWTGANKPSTQCAGATGYPP